MIRDGATTVQILTHSGKLYTGPAADWRALLEQVHADGEEDAAIGSDLDLLQDTVNASALHALLDAPPGELAAAQAALIAAVRGG